MMAGSASALRVSGGAGDYTLQIFKYNPVPANRFIRLPYLMLIGSIIVFAKDMVLARSSVRFFTGFSKFPHHTCEGASWLECKAKSKLCHNNTVSHKRIGGEHSAPFACTVLTRDYGDAFGSSATTGGSSFSFVYPDFGLSFFSSVSAKMFRPVGKRDPEDR
jgi:hypothetical protein